MDLGEKFAHEMLPQDYDLGEKIITVQEKSGRRMTYPLFGQVRICFFTDVSGVGQIFLKFDDFDSGKIKKKEALELSYGSLVGILEDLS